jgi:hypothetical protein
MARKKTKPPEEMEPKEEVFVEGEILPVAPDLKKYIDPKTGRFAAEEFLPAHNKTVNSMGLRKAVLKALDEMGGVQYLVDLAKDKPNLFVQLLTRILPRPPNTAEGELKDGHGGEITFEFSWTPPKEN